MRLFAPRTTLLFLSILVAGMLLVACGGNGANVETALPQAIHSEAATEAITESPTNTLPPVPETQVPAALKTNEAGTGYPPPLSAAPTTPTGGYPAPTEPPLVKTELQASDPTTVQLASGKPQLVEFFAFW